MLQRSFVPWPVQLKEQEPGVLPGPQWFEPVLRRRGIELRKPFA
jgi:hypothetical protein